jgi:hypothetical protein
MNPNGRSYERLEPTCGPLFVSIQLIQLPCILTRRSCMALKTLTVCEWKDRHCLSRAISDPRWEDIVEAIRRLDNGSFNDVYLSRDDDPEHFWLCIGGGAGQYVVSGAAGEGQFPSLVTPGASATENVELLVGGQGGLFPRSRIHSLETALKAAKHFYEHGDFGGDLHWENL